MAKKEKKTKNDILLEKIDLLGERLEEIKKEIKKIEKNQSFSQVFASVALLGAIFFATVSLSLYTKNSNLFWASFIVYIILIVFLCYILAIMKRLKSKKEKKLKMMNGKKKDLEGKKCPLSREGWIMFLSGEIHNEEMKWYTSLNVFIAVTLAFLSGIIVAFASGLSAANENRIMILVVIYILVILSGIVYLIFLRHKSKTQKKLVPTREIRKDIINGDLTDTNEIRKRCKEEKII